MVLLLLDYLVIVIDEVVGIIVDCWFCWYFLRLVVLRVLFYVWWFDSWLIG